eukprot:6811317-Prymnesium_polylepis.2
MPTGVDILSPCRARALQLAAELVELSPHAFGGLLRALGAPARPLELLLQRADRDVRLVEQLLCEPPLAVLQPQVAAERRDLLGQLARKPLGRAQLGVLCDQPEDIVVPAQLVHARLQPEPRVRAHRERDAARLTPRELCLGRIGGRRRGRRGGDALAAQHALVGGCCVGRAVRSRPEILVGRRREDFAAHLAQRRVVAVLGCGASVLHLVEELLHGGLGGGPAGQAALRLFALRLARCHWQILVCAAE